MLGFKSYTSACVTIHGIESVRMLRKGQVIGQKLIKIHITTFAI